VVSEIALVHEGRSVETELIEIPIVTKVSHWSILISVFWFRTLKHFPCLCVQLARRVTSSLGVNKIFYDLSYYRIVLWSPFRGVRLPNFLSFLPFWGAKDGTQGFAHARQVLYL
jgi:hypothetical protein